MNNRQLREQLRARIDQKGWRCSWDNDREALNITIKETEEPVSVTIPSLQQRIDEHHSAEEVVNQTIQKLEAVATAMEKRTHIHLDKVKNHIFPVLRSTSFPEQTKDEKTLVFDSHTAETRVYYAVDFGNSYTLIDQSMLDNTDITFQQLKEIALFNLGGLTTTAKTDEVAGNLFYFISTNDGYAASRILNRRLVEQYAQKGEGKFGLAVPHQDVLILADIRNSTGYDVLGQMTMNFYSQGTMPITALPFMYENDTLNPIFIMARKK